MNIYLRLNLHCKKRPHSVEHKPLSRSFENEGPVHDKRNPGLLRDQDVPSVHGMPEGAALGALSRLLYLCKGLHSLSGHAAVGCTAVPQSLLGEVELCQSPPPHLVCPWLSSWLIQGNPERLTLNLMALVGSWEIAGDLSSHSVGFFFNIEIFSKATNKKLFLKPTFKKH